MALSNLPKNHLVSLLSELNLSKIEDHNLVEKIQSDHSGYAKLDLIRKQMEFLKLEAKNIIENSIIIDKLHNIPCKFKKYPGNIYHLYKNNEEYYLSKLSLSDWNNKPPHKYINSFLYDYDKSLCIR